MYWNNLFLFKAARHLRPRQKIMKQICGMIAFPAIISGANLILIKRAAGERDPGPRRVPARSRVPANEGLGRQLACDVQATLRKEGVAP
jgi:hypothetical protein